jgi:hypothetical protein
MTATRARALRWATIPLVALGLMAAAAPAHAIPPNEDVGPYVFPAGQACAFPLEYKGTGAAFTTHTKGRVTITAGRGYALTLTNVDTGASITTRSAGFAEIATTLRDGTQRVEALGSNLLIFYPTDVPAGPSTTLYTGRVVYTIDANAVWTLRSTSGHAKDMCAALS